MQAWAWGRLHGAGGAYESRELGRGGSGPRNKKKKRGPKQGTRPNLCWAPPLELQNDGDGGSTLNRYIDLGFNREVYAMMNCKLGP